MKESLRQKLVSYLKEHRKVHWKELERFCTQNEYRWADNGTKRLREVRDKNHQAYDPQVGVTYYPNSETIEYYTYGEPPLDVKVWFKLDTCCPSKKIFGVCSQDCQKVKVGRLL